MGLILSVYRNAEITQDCTNGGISSRFGKVCVINVEGPFDPREGMPAVVLGRGPMGHPILQDVEDVALNRWTMFGGNYGMTSDSRFGEAVRRITGWDNYGNVAIPFHDRVETREQQRLYNPANVQYDAPRKTPGSR